MRRLVIAAALFLPVSAYAGFSITEIMYDLPGADSGREWIEIQNTGTSTENLSQWRFYEANTNHVIKSDDSDAVLPQEFAVIADKPEMFRADWPNYSGLLFDSAFSLSNSGETLALKKGDEVYAANYDSSYGAAGDGNSLNLVGGMWLPRKPSPGAAASLEAILPPPKKIDTNTSSAASAGAPKAEALSTAQSSTTAAADTDKKEPLSTGKWILLLSGIVMAGFGAFLLFGKSGESGYKIVRVEGDLD